MDIARRLVQKLMPQPKMLAVQHVTIERHVMFDVPSGAQEHRQGIAPLKAGGDIAERDLGRICARLSAVMISGLQPFGRNARLEPCGCQKL